MRVRLNNWHLDARQKDEIESTMLDSLVGKVDDKLAGAIRIGTLSSLLQSVVVPSLGEILRKNPAVGYSFIVQESSPLSGSLVSAALDMTITDTETTNPNLVSFTLAEDRYVLIESSKHESDRETLIDVGPNDLITLKFMQKAKRPMSKFKRAFIQSNDGLLEGVAQGLGMAVIEERFVIGNRRVRPVKGFDAVSLPLYLHQWNLPFYTPLQTAVVAELKKHVFSFLFPSKR